MNWSRVWLGFKVLTTWVSYIWGIMLILMAIEKLFDPDGWKWGLIIAFIGVWFVFFGNDLSHHILADERMKKIKLK